MLHGAEDKICSPDGSKRLHEEAVSEDKEIVLVENAVHNLFLETEDIRLRAVKDAFDWIEKRL